MFNGDYIFHIFRLFVYHIMQYYSSKVQLTRRVEFLSTTRHMGEARRAKLDQLAIHIELSLTRVVSSPSQQSHLKYCFTLYTTLFI